MFGRFLLQRPIISSRYMSSVSQPEIDLTRRSIHRTWALATAVIGLGICKRYIGNNNLESEVESLQNELKDLESGMESLQNELKETNKSVKELNEFLKAISSLL